MFRNVKLNSQLHAHGTANTSPYSNLTYQKPYNYWDDKDKQRALFDELSKKLSIFCTKLIIPSTY